MNNLFRPSSFNVSFFDESIARKKLNKNKRYVIGYARLSFDEDGTGYSSILNQKELLDSIYVKEFQDTTSEYVFIDDDNVSGYKFDRPGLFRVLQMIEQGKCNIIIAKDLSRIGRHGALTQLFIEQCERVGIRIKAMEDYDSHKESDEMILGIKAWSNERVVKDTSAKINKIIGHQQENGTWFCAAPFGYVPDFRKKTITVDEVARRVLEDIAEMFLKQDWGINKIARVLTAQKAPTPSMRERDRLLEEGREYKKKVSENWNATQIAAILDNDFYNGVYRTGKYTREGINGKDVRVDSSEHKVFPNHHEKIYSDEVFQAIRAKRTKRKEEGFRRKENTQSLFHGMLYCGDCGSRMYIYANGKVAPHYVCSRYFKYGTDYCSRHAIKVSILEEYAFALLGFVKTQCPELIHSMDGELNELLRRGKNKLRESSENIAEQIRKLNVELEAIEVQRVKQIVAHPERESILNGIYDKMHEDAQERIDKLEESYAVCLQCEQGAKDSTKKIKTAMDVIDKVLEERILTRGDVEALFEKIVIYENGDIDIHLIPDIQAIGLPNAHITEKPNKHPAQEYEFENINEVSEGDPSLITFISIAALANGLDRLAKAFVKNRGYSK